MDLDTYLSNKKETGVELAQKLGVSPVLVSQWRNGVRDVPAERCPDIEAATGGAITCEELRPDVNWAVVRKSMSRPEARAQ
jgi:DNA-binding transcriptional regulator YdaS (Cro superfamily)